MGVYVVRYDVSEMCERETNERQSWYNGMRDTNERCVLVKDAAFGS